MLQRSSRRLEYLAEIVLRRKIDLAWAAVWMMDARDATLGSAARAMATADGYAGWGSRATMLDYLPVR